MRTLTQNTLYTLALVATLGACSRPVATFQPSKAERFYTAQATPIAPATNVPEAQQPLAVAPAAVPATPMEDVLAKTEAYATTKAAPAEARQLTRRMAKIRQVLSASPKLAAPQEVVNKPTLVQRIMQKSLDKKIQKHLAPNQPQRSNTLTAGLVVALVGLLLLLLLNGVGATLGLIALVIGIVLIILGLI